jgi:O-antigen/teichoic acid export membrane protein
MASVGLVETGSPALTAPTAGAAAAAPRGLLGRASIAGAGSIYQQCLTFLSGLIVARVLGAADYGVFNLARNLVDTTSILTRAGLDIGLQRHFGEGRSLPDQSGRRLVLHQLRLVTALLALLPVMAVALGLGRVLESNVYPHAGFAQLLLCLALALPFVTDLTVLGGAYRGNLHLTPAVLAESVLMPTARLLIIVMLFMAGWRLWAVALGTTTGAVLASAWLALRARRDFRAPVTTAPWAEARRVLRYSWVMAAAVLVTTLTNITDILTLGRFVPAEQLGQYSLAKTLLLLTGFFAAAFTQGLGGMVADRHFQGDRAGVVDVLSSTFQWIALATLPMFAIFLIWGSQLMPLFGGASFSIAPAVVAWLACGQLVFALFGHMGWALSMTGRHLVEFAILAAGLIIAVVLCALLVPARGQLGAAIATFSAIAFVNGARMIYVRNALGMFPFGGRIFLFAGCGLLLAVAARALSVRLGLAPTWAMLAGIGMFLPCYAAACWLYLHTAGRSLLRPVPKETRP